MHTMESTAPVTIDEYIAGFAPDVQEILQQVRLTIRQAAPEAQETINYQMPTYCSTPAHALWTGRKPPCR
jgi:uncharacterized protein YdhG (YjbR/CyaY superfamily)